MVLFFQQFGWDGSTILRNNHIDGEALLLLERADFDQLKIPVGIIVKVTQALGRLAPAAPSDSIASVERPAFVSPAIGPKHEG